MSKFSTLIFFRLFDGIQSNQRCLQRLRDNRNKCHAQRRRIYDQSFDLAAEEEDPILIDGRGDRVRNQGHLQNTVSILSIDEIMEQEWNHVSEKFQPHVYSESVSLASFVLKHFYEIVGRQ